MTVGALAALSMLPLDAKHAIGTTGDWHVFGHVAAFAVTGVLFLQDRQPIRLVPLSLWPLAALAVLLEGLQVAVYRNDFEWSDVGSDLLGLLAGFLAYQFTTSRRPRPK